MSKEVFPCKEPGCWINYPGIRLFRFAWNRKYKRASLVSFKRRAFPRRTFHPYLSPMYFHILPGQGQSQSCPNMFPCVGAVSLLKPLKDTLLILRFNTDTGVGN